MKNQTAILRAAGFEKEFSFRMSRSSGKGGQHVNKVSTKVELLFDVTNSALLEAEEKAMIFEKLGAIISQNGILQIKCQKTRSQLRNREMAIEKFFQKIEKALTPQKPRKPTKKSKAANAKRLQEKRRQADKKKHRQKVDQKNTVNLFCF